MSNFYKVKLTVENKYYDTPDNLRYESVECYLSINTLWRHLHMGRIIFNDEYGIKYRFCGFDFLKSYTLNESLLERFDSKFVDYLEGKFFCKEIEEIIGDKLTVGSTYQMTGDNFMNYHRIKYSGERKKIHEMSYFIDCQLDNDEDFGKETSVTDEIIELPHTALAYQSNLFEDLERTDFIVTSMDVIRQYHLSEALSDYTHLNFINAYYGYHDYYDDLSNELKDELEMLNIEWDRDCSLDILLN